VELKDFYAAERNLKVAATNKKTFRLRKTGNEGIQRTPPEDNPASWPHPSLDGEVDPAWRDLDEHKQ